MIDSSEQKLKRRNRIFWSLIAGAIGLSCVCLSVAMGASVVANYLGIDFPVLQATPRSLPASPRYIVEYEITGSAHAADITMENAGGNTEQRNVTLPWSTTFNGQPGQFVYISAQSDDNDSETINCAIRVDGRTIESASSEGRYVIATCSGRVR